MRKTRKPVALGIVLALVAALGVGGTIAWLTAQSDPVKNTFTVGDIDITLQEHKLQDDGTLGKETTNSNSYDIVPGNIYPKDPFITVDPDSEDCWLFVEITEVNNAFEGGKYLGWNIASGWDALDGESGVYYQKVSSSDTDQFIYILKDDIVTVSSDLTNAQIKLLDKDGDKVYEEEEVPALTFVAYAIQQSNFDTAAKAWAELNKK